MANENTARINLHRHLQGYKGQILSFEMVKDLMSYVFDMVKDPNVSWVSKDSHIRLLNGIFKKVGQTVDDTSITGIEETICSAFAFRRPNEIQSSIGRRAQPDKPGDSPLKPNNQADTAAAPIPVPKDKAAAASDNEALYRHMHQALSTFENRIVKMMEISYQENRETAKNLVLDRVELEARLTIEREELVSILSNARAEYRTYLSKEHEELMKLINWFLQNQDERSKQTEQSLDGRIQALKSVMKIMKDNIEAMLTGHTDKQTAGITKTEDMLDSRWQSMEQKLNDMQDKVSLSRKALRRMNIAYVIGLIIMAAGFGILFYFR